MAGQSPTGQRGGGWYGGVLLGTARVLGFSLAILAEPGSEIEGWLTSEV